MYLSVQILFTGSCKCFLMATLQLKLDTRYKLKDGSYPIVIRLRSKNKSRNIKSGIKILKHQWKNGQVIKHSDAQTINSILYDKMSEYQNLLYQCLKEGRDIIDAVDKNKKIGSFNSWFRIVLERKRSIGKNEYARKLENVLNDIEVCFDGHQSFQNMNREWINKLHTYLLGKGNGANTIFKKMKVLRQMFENARKEGLTNAPNHFYGYKLKKTPVKKEKLSVEEVKLLAMTPMKGRMNDVRNLFMFSYYCWGVRFNDCIKAKWEDIKDNKIIFSSTAKSNKSMAIELHPKLKELIGQYEFRREKEYIFPFEARKDSNNAMCNRYLKSIAALCGIKINLTFHIARHSFAYHMKLKDTSIEVIKDLLGHSDVRITEVYLKSFDDDRLNKEANKLYHFE